MITIKRSKFVKESGNISTFTPPVYHRFLLHKLSKQPHRPPNRGNPSLCFPHLYANVQYNTTSGHQYHLLPSSRRLLGRSNHAIKLCNDCLEARALVWVAVPTASHKANELWWPRSVDLGSRVEFYHLSDEVSLAITLEGHTVARHLPQHDTVAVNIACLGVRFLETYLWCHITQRTCVTRHLVRVRSIGSRSHQCAEPKVE